MDKIIIVTSGEYSDYHTPSIYNKDDVTDPNHPDFMLKTIRDGLVK